MLVNKVENLLCNLNDKKGYVAHIKNLQQAFNHGLKIVKAHKVIKFEQEVWLNSYIKSITKLRTNAK